ncbi:hypothetical protein OROHE_014735 [Orobanche hederae]
MDEHACGTWASLTWLEFDERESRRHALAGNIPAVAYKMRESSMQGVRDCARILSDKELGKRVMVDNYAEAAHRGDGPNCKVIWVTDWSKFGDYELEFGFGKPVWVSLSDVPQKDMFILMNTKDNEGIEAWAFLDESDMPFFEQDEFIRRLTTPLSKM